MTKRTVRYREKKPQDSEESYRRFASKYFFSLHRHHTRRAHLIVVAGAKYAIGVPVLVHVPRVVIPAARAEHDLHLHVLVPEHEFGRLVRIAAIGSTLEDLGGGRWLKCEATDYSRDIIGQEGIELLVSGLRHFCLLFTHHYVILKP